MNLPHNVPMGEQVLRVFRDHPNVWMDTGEICKLMKGKATPGQICGHIRVLSSLDDKFERIVTSSHRRLYRYNDSEVQT